MNEPMIRRSDVPVPQNGHRADRHWFRSREERAADKAAAAVRVERLRIEQQRARDQRELEALEADREKARVRGELVELAEVQQAKSAKERQTLRQRISRAVVLASANVGINAVAVTGQTLGLMLGMDWPWWAAIPLALVVESVAVNIGYIAHDKLINGHSAGWLRVASYSIGAGFGWFNYVENAAVPTTKGYALVFGACSVLSPVLWQIYSRWKHWQQLRTQGLLEARAPKFLKLRWIIPSLRGETWQAFKLAVAEGIQSPEAAITAVRARTATGTTEAALRQAREALIAAQGDALRLTLTHLAAVAHDLDGEDPAATEARANIALFIKRFRPFIPPLDLDAQPSPPRHVEEPDPEPGKNQRRPSDEDNRKTRQRIARHIRSGKPVPSKAEVAGWHGFSESWGYGRIREAKAELIGEGWSFPDGSSPVPPAGSSLVVSESPNGRGRA